MNVQVEPEQSRGQWPPIATLPLKEAEVLLEGYRHESESNISTEKQEVEQKRKSDGIEVVLPDEGRTKDRTPSNPLDELVNKVMDGVENLGDLRNYGMDYEPLEEKKAQEEEPKPEPVAEKPQDNRPIASELQTSNLPSSLAKDLSAIPREPGSELDNQQLAHDLGPIISKLKAMEVDVSEGPVTSVSHQATPGQKMEQSGGMEIG